MTRRGLALGTAHRYNLAKLSFGLELALAEIEIVLKRGREVIDVVKMPAVIPFGFFHQADADHVVNDFADVRRRFDPPVFENSASHQPKLIQRKNSNGLAK